MRTPTADIWTALSPPTAPAEPRTELAAAGPRPEAAKACQETGSYFLPRLSRAPRSSPVDLQGWQQLPPLQLLAWTVIERVQSLIYLPSHLDPPRLRLALGPFSAVLPLPSTNQDSLPSGTTAIHSKPWRFPAPPPRIPHMTTMLWSGTSLTRMMVHFP